jgi:cephalosporin hydroxylase
MYPYPFKPSFISGHPKAGVENSLNTPVRKLLELMHERKLTVTSYFGVQVLKNPLDMWVYQEMIFDQKPAVLVEIGNWQGGSALAFAHWFDLLGKGRVICVDVDHSLIQPVVWEHPRISFVTGDAAAVLPQVAASLVGEERNNVMVIEDSSHEMAQTLGVLRAYAPLTPIGRHFVVEDGICRHGIDMGPTPGPMEACEAFVAEDPRFEIDRSLENWLLTWNPKGFLRRVA